MKIYIDGQFYDKENAKISVFDHGLLYGDGVFEGIRFYNGRVFRLEEHIDRLFDSARAIALKIGRDTSAVIEATLETIRQNNLQDGYIRLVVTRGVGDLGLNPMLCPKASIFVIASKITLYSADKYENGLDVVTCSTRRIPHGALSPMVKSLNYLNNVMAKIEAQNAGAGEGLMLNEQGFVAECTGENIFCSRNGIILTPPLTAGALEGITQSSVMAIGRDMGIDMRIDNIARSDLYIADEIFVCGTAAEVSAVSSVDDRAVPAPGPATTAIGQMYGRVVRGQEAKYAHWCELVK